MASPLLPDTLNSPLARKQLELTRHIRDPQTFPRPLDVEERRASIYRELLFNNVQGFLQDNFPVLRELYADEEWESLTRDFFANHRSKTPYFPQFPEEFLQYLQEERQPRAEDPPFLLELAHYEYAEVVLTISEEEFPENLPRGGDLLDEIPILSPLVLLLAYHYPVHKISPDFRPEKAPEQPTQLVAYRNRRDEVGFLEVNPVTFRLLESLQADSGKSGRQLMEEIALEINHPDPEAVIQGGHDILKNLYFLDIIAGVRPDRKAA
ncbi:MAG: putative DNA-binding domain-containing protein [Chromatiales bacterium]|nr:putative DNA-binding domain-containing protein [Chromatiales bacterium]